MIPAGLVRFLLGCWKKRHTDLWLVDHCSLKYYLRKHTEVEFIPAAPPGGWDGNDSISSGESESDSDSSCSEVSSLSTEDRPNPFLTVGVDDLKAELGLEEFDSD